jgi:hypothetical protein
MQDSGHSRTTEWEVGFSQQSVSKPVRGLYGELTSWTKWAV